MQNRCRYKYTNVESTPREEADRTIGGRLGWSEVEWLRQGGMIASPSSQTGLLRSSGAGSRVESFSWEASVCLGSSRRVSHSIQASVQGKHFKHGMGSVSGFLQWSFSKCSHAHGRWMYGLLCARNHGCLQIPQHETPSSL